MLSGRAALAISRQLVRFIEALTRGRLTYRGRSYRLAARADLGMLPDRGSYEPVRPAEARQLLDALAAESAVILRLVLARARRKLISGGQRLSSHPGSLVLLRRKIRPRDVRIMCQCRPTRRNQ